jgi:hypothetical protein
VEGGGAEGWAIVLENLDLMKVGFSLPVSVLMKQTKFDFQELENREGRIQRSPTLPQRVKTKCCPLGLLTSWIT